MKEDLPFQPPIQLRKNYPVNIIQEVVTLLGMEEWDIVIEKN